MADVWESESSLQNQNQTVKNCFILISHISFYIPLTLTLLSKSKVFFNGIIIVLSLSEKKGNASFFSLCEMTH